MCEYYYGYFLLHLSYLVTLNAHRTVQGILTGFDPLMNLLLTDAAEILPDGTSRRIGTMVFLFNLIIIASE